MEWVFGGRFNTVTRGVVDPCSLEEAEQRHRDGVTYCALLRDEGGRSLAAIELKSTAAAGTLYVFDGQQRTVLMYVYSPAERGGLFLQQMHVLHYLSAEDPESSSGQVIRVREDGTAFMTEVDRVADTFTESEGMREPEFLEAHYLEVPEFGEWASMMRTDIGRPLDEQPADSPSWLALETPVS